MSDAQDVRVTNKELFNPISGFILTIFLMMVFLTQCTSTCKNMNEIQCFGKMSKEFAVEFNKGYDAK